MAAGMTKDELIELCKEMTDNPALIELGEALQQAEDEELDTLSFDEQYERFRRYALKVYNNALDIEPLATRLVPLALGGETVLSAEQAAKVRETVQMLRATVRDLLDVVEVRLPQDRSDNWARLRGVIYPGDVTAE